MNKFAIFGAMALMTVGFAACDDYEEPNAAPQTNPQLPVLKADQVTLADDMNGATYTLQELSQNGESIKAATITAPNLGPAYTYAASVTVTADGSNRTFEVPATVTVANADSTSYDVLVSPDDIQGEYYANVSKGPKARDLEMTFALYTVSTGANVQKARIGGTDTTFGPYKLNIVPFPSTRVIEEAYYIYGSFCGWDVTKAVKLTNSGADPYDDPVFSVKLDITGGDWWWKLVPESSYVAAVNNPEAHAVEIGVVENGDEALNGTLTDENPGAGCLKVEGPYLLKVNMEELTYDFSLALDQLYTPGNSNGWNQGASQILTTTDYVNYAGYVYLDGEFKFSSQLDWGGTNWGSTGEEGKLTTDGGAGNLSAPAGLYWAQANISALTYSLSDPITTYGLIGDATPGGWDASTPLTPDETFLVWTGTIHFNGAGEFKFRANDAWDINLGGDLLNLTPGGANIPTPGEGDYEVILDLGVYPYSCNLMKK